MVGLLYVVCALFARRWDLLSLRKISIVPLCGKDGPFKYELTVITGSRKGAGRSIVPRPVSELKTYQYDL